LSPACVVADTVCAATVQIAETNRTGIVVVTADEAVVGADHGVMWRVRVELAITGAAIPPEADTHVADLDAVIDIGNDALVSHLLAVDVADESAQHHFLIRFG
jgi:hypothetical protein